MPAILDVPDVIAPLQALETWLARPQTKERMQTAVLEAVAAVDNYTLVKGHAVVFQIENFGGPNERIICMDPESGTYENKDLDEFLHWWDTPGQRGFVLRA